MVSASMYYYPLRPIQQLLLHMLQLQQRFYLRSIFSCVEVVKLTLDLLKIKHGIRKGYGPVRYTNGPYLKHHTDIS